MTPDEFIETVNENKLDDVRAALAAEPQLAKAQAWGIGTTALHCASHRGFTEIVRLLLENGADVHAREKASDTIALHWAAEGGHPAIAELLVEKGSDLTAIDEWYGLSPIGWASVVIWAPPFHEDRLATVNYLLNAGARLDIFSAIVLGQPEKIKAIVRLDKKALSRRMGYVAAGVQPLHLAISRQLTDMVKLLLDLGADINGRTGSGVTPLGIAISKQDAAIAKLLMERGARDDISTALVSGDLASMAVHLTGLHDPDLVTSLLFLAARMGKSDAVQLLVKNGADPNARTKQLIQEMPAMATPLHLAALAGNAAVRGLIQVGAVVNPDTEEGAITPLHLAASGGHLEAVQDLLQAGANPNLRDKNFGATPKDWAEHGGHTAIVELLGKVAQ